MGKHMFGALGKDRLAGLNGREKVNHLFSCIVLNYEVPTPLYQELSIETVGIIQEHHCRSHSMSI